MAIVNLSEASRLTGKSRDTLYRHIRTGKVSVAKDTVGQGGYLFDTSELIRAYGGIKALKNSSDSTPAELQKSDTVVQYLTSEKDSEISLLKELIKVKNEQLESAMQREEWMRKQIDELTSTVKLIQHESPQEAEKKKRWWQR